jgi:phenylalanyl-tRNA synthetase beta chain
MLHIPQDAEERKFIKIKNPIGEDLSVMRTTMIPSMVNVIVRNLRRGNMQGKLFELAKVYIAKQLPLEDFPIEKQMLCLAQFGDCDFFDLKGVCNLVADTFNQQFEYVPATKPYIHRGICADILCEGQTVGFIGQLDPTIAEELTIDKNVILCQIDYEKLTDLSKQFKYVPIPKFPEQTRDLALVVDSRITCAQIEKEIKNACKYVTAVKLFDIYVGNQIESGKKSMAFNITFTPKDEAISNENVDSYIKKILNNLKFKLNITIR